MVGLPLSQGFSASLISSTFLRSGSRGALSDEHPYDILGTICVS